MMLLDTKRLFIRLLKVLKVDCTCDVGSLNGAEAFDFRDAAPTAKVFAFEANPVNANLIRSKKEIAAAGIQLIERAVTNYDGEAKFFIVDTDYSGTSPERGMSSLFDREGARMRESAVTVRAQRLDTFFLEEGSSSMRAALWIDVEGKAYEVLEGLAASASRVVMLHAEVETVPCIHAEQKLRNHFIDLSGQLGFTVIACDGPDTLPQQNLLLVRTDLVTMNVRRKALEVMIWSRLRSAWWRIKRTLRLP